MADELVLTGTLPDVTVSNNADWPAEIYTLLASPDGPVFDLTGCRLLMQVKRSSGESTVFLDCASPTCGIAILSETNGQFAIAPAAVLLRQVPAGQYIRDVILLSGARRIGFGRSNVTVLQGITLSS